jgi:hypothetical protein
MLCNPGNWLPVGIGFNAIGVAHIFLDIPSSRAYQNLKSVTVASISSSLCARQDRIQRRNALIVRTINLAAYPENGCAFCEPMTEDAVLSVGYPGVMACCMRLCPGIRQIGRRVFLRSETAQARSRLGFARYIFEEIKPRSGRAFC